MVSLCLTIKNENLDLILKKILSQSVLPDEIVIVDASNREQFASSRNYNIYKKYKIKYFFEKCNRSEGRNRGVLASTSENLVFIDGDCTPQKKWFFEIKKAICHLGAEVVAGGYASRVTSFFEYLLNKFLNKNEYYPSARNFAIKRKIFTKTTRFDPKLKTAEDLAFFSKLADRGHKIESAKQALVIWKLPGFFEYFRKIFFYSAGDMKSWIWWDKRKKFNTHNVQLVFNLLRYGGVIALISLGYTYLAIIFYGTYLASSVIKNKIDFTEFAGRNALKIGKNIMIYLVLKFLTDMASISGFIAGVII